ncbi:MAG: DNA polymerase III subunit gamma/tau [Deltaproteobacteria bacterium]|nr:MAG: DNA polymerase III subunit gamma/tau [Deltaproteobacteria bacterium]
MSKDVLTNTYRPQTFEQVAGQHAITAILSQAAAQDRVAPAYLFSGTRGVGKTTIARIFAKAVNCQDAPAAEPCNTCRTCCQITQGSSVDVLEIDGASHTGVDNVRKLQEHVAYAPLDCRYKVIIIDEAHMLSKQAFNALLKTLEEPPEHVVFIMATTEPEKFPQTIISRCQHYVFKRLAAKELVDHLCFILNQESIPFEPQAVNLVARRGAGSVRDAMSLLAQVLALGQDGLRVRDVREVLGLADQEMYLELVQAIAHQDLLAMTRIQADILDKGLDLIFFLRELVLCWRNLFLLHQLGDKALALIDLPQEEVEAWQACAATLSLSHVHACWQMTLEGQRRVQTSLEPGLDLEMLLINLSYLPSLLPLDKVPTGTPAGSRARKIPPAALSSGSSSDVSASALASTVEAPKVVASKTPVNGEVRAMEQGQHMVQERELLGEGKQQVPDASDEPYIQEGVKEEPGVFAVSSVPKLDWQDFVAFCHARKGKTGQGFMFLKQVQGVVEADRIRISCFKDFVYEQCSNKETLGRLGELARAWAGRSLEIVVEPPQEPTHVSYGEVRKQALEDPLVKEVMDTFGAQVVDIHTHQ